MFADVLGETRTLQQAHRRGVTPDKAAASLGRFHQALVLKVRQCATHGVAVDHKLPGQLVLGRQFVPRRQFTSFNPTLKVPRNFTPQRHAVCLADFHFSLATLA